MPPTAPSKLDESLTGGCMCGEIRFVATGPPKWTAFCHCSSCRRHTGAPVSAFAGFERQHVTWTSGQLARFASSPGVERGFCITCGATLTYEGDRWPTEIHVHIGAFDDPERVPPRGETFPDERLSWLHLTPPPQAG
ncbi:GFA family protein [bacterium]|nr:GFA family protein [bacterium]